MSKPKMVLAVNVRLVAVGEANAGDPTALVLENRDNAFNTITIPVTVEVAQAAGNHLYKNMRLGLTVDGEE